MERRLSRFLTYGFCLFLSLSLTSVMHGVTWSNGVPPTDVTDTDLILDAAGGNIIFPTGGTTILADTTDVMVTVTGGDAVLQGNGGGESQLYLCAEQGNRITFDLTDTFDLEFVGSSDGTTPLLIVVGGSGFVDFVLRGGQTVSFNKRDEFGPTLVYVLIADIDEGDGHLIFKRNDLLLADNNENVVIMIGPDCIMSYLANEVDSDRGTITFLPANDGDGRMVLDIKDCGAYIIAGHFVDESEKTSITTGNIDMTVAAGTNAITDIDEVVSDEYDINPHAGLLVLNRNTKCFDLLIDPFCNLGAADDEEDFNGGFTGIRYGYVLGANGLLRIQGGAYFDYVALTNNICWEVDEIPGLESMDQAMLLKKRNPSAFFVDGSHDPAARPARINLGFGSGIFFRSGVNSEGVIDNALGTMHEFTIDPMLMTKGAGEVVFSVEGALNVHGSNAAINDIFRSTMELLSLHVNPTGCPLFPTGGIGPFPCRSFDLDGDGLLRRYNKGAWLINNNVHLIGTSWVHTDENHLVCQKNDTKSEPAYIGGESSRLSELKGDDPTIQKPYIAFENSRLHVRTDIALTGFNLRVPNRVLNTVCQKNLSKFIFYGNGKCVDEGTGRHMILGTDIGSKACDHCTLICREAHLDIFQDQDCLSLNVSPDDPTGDHTLMLTVDVNNETIEEDIGVKDIEGQSSIHTIYLGFNSNISIGSDSDNSGFDTTTTPWLKIAGNYFSFETRGGIVSDPTTSAITGTGGIFVDLNGKLSICPDFRASFSTMIVRSHNAIIDLPKTQVFIDHRIGVTDWQLDLSDPEQRVIVGPDECFSDYTLDWMGTQKDYDNFCPYEVGDVTICECPEVLEENVSSLPTVQGIVGQLQIENSRLGDPVNVKIDCGHVRELLWLPGNQTAEAPIAVVVLENYGRIGISSAEKNIDSLFANTAMGINGIMVIANGPGFVELNEDVCVTNICSFLKGPDFTDSDVLTINSDVARELRFTKDGILDLRSFDIGTVRFSGQVKLIFEPGSRILLGNGILEFAQDSEVIFEQAVKAKPFFDGIPLGNIDNSLDPLVSRTAVDPQHEFSPLLSYADGLHNTDKFRVRIIGEGTMRFKDNARALIRQGAFVGIETLSEVLRDEQTCEITTTNVTLQMQDNSEFLIGRENFLEGGSLQIGNVEEFDGHSITFTLELDGNNAEFVIGSLGFFGLGTGIVRGCASTPNELLIDTTFNVAEINFDFKDGHFNHDRIYDGDDARASLLAIGEVPSMNITFEELSPDIDGQRLSNFDISGGGNIVQITAGSGGANGSPGAIRPIVRIDDNVIAIPVTGSDPVDSQRMVAGIQASRFLLPNLNVTAASGNAFFIAIKTQEGTAASTTATGLANAAPAGENFRDARTQGRLGHIDRDAIGRDDLSDIIDEDGGSPENRRSRAYEISALYVFLDPDEDPPAPVLYAVQAH